MLSFEHPERHDGEELCSSHPLLGRQSAWFLRRLNEMPRMNLPTMLDKATVLKCLGHRSPVSKGSSASLPDLVPFWTETVSWNAWVRGSAFDSMRSSGKLFEKELAYASTKSYVPEATQRTTGKASDLQSEHFGRLDRCGREVTKVRAVEVLFPKCGKSKSMFGCPIPLHMAVWS